MSALTPTPSGLLNEAVAAAGLGHAWLAELAVLFRAIKADSAETSSARELAALGGRLADDWANTLDVEHERLSGLQGVCA